METEYSALLLDAARRSLELAELLCTISRQLQLPHRPSIDPGEQLNTALQLATRLRQAVADSCRAANILVQQ